MQVVHLARSAGRVEDAIRAAQGSGDTVLVMWGTFCQLGSELGGQGSATGWLRDLAFGPLCAFPPTRDMMLSTLAGVRRGWLGTFPVNADGRPDIPMV